MTVPAVDLTDKVVAAVNAARAAKTDENVVSELEAVLKELRTSEKRLGVLTSVIPHIPGASARGAQLDECRARLNSVEEAAAGDAIGAARSEEGRALVRQLNATVPDLTQRATAAWNEFRIGLRAEFRTDFFRKLADLPGFAMARELVVDNYAVQEVVNSSQLPEAEKLRQAKAARARIDDGLRKLQALLPDEVRRPLEQCFGGELRLVDVKPEFLDWIREHGLEDDFTVEAS